MKQTAIEHIFIKSDYMIHNCHKQDFVNVLVEAKEMEKQQKDEFATEFYKWLISQDGQDTIHDAIMFGDINKNPTPEELLEQFKNK